MISMDSKKNNSDFVWQKIWENNNLIQKILGVAREKYTSVFMNIIHSELNHETNFLEIGSGSGTFTIEIAKHVKKSTGIDLSSNAIKMSTNKAKAVNSKASFIIADCFNLPFKDNYFDVIWSQGFLQAIPKPTDCLKEQLRVCKKNGVILATVPAKYSYLWVFRKITKTFFLNFLWPWPEQIFYSKKDFLNLGLKISKNAEVSSEGILKELILLKIRK